MSRLLFAVATLSAICLPVLLLPRVGLPETWAAFHRYIHVLLHFSEHHDLRVPQAASPVRNYSVLDADLLRWHADLRAVYEDAASMAVVGQLQADGLEFHFHRQAGAQRRALKKAFYAPRDLSLLAYLAASLLSYWSRSIPLSLLVLVLNVLSLGLCIRLKVLMDALAKVVEQLGDAQQDLLALPLEPELRPLQQQAVCLQKLTAMSEAWEGRQFGFRRAAGRGVVGSLHMGRPLDHTYDNTGS